MADRVRFWLSKTGPLKHSPLCYQNFVNHLRDKHGTVSAACLNEELRKWGGLYKGRGRVRNRFRDRGYLLFSNQQHMTTWVLTWS